MQIGMIGLGRMGANIVRRLCARATRALVYDRDPAPAAELAGEGALARPSLAERGARRWRRPVWFGSCCRRV